MCCLITTFVNFSKFLLFLISDLIPSLVETIFCVISALLNLLKFFHGLLYVLTWRMVQEYLRRMFILLLLDGVFYRCLLGSVGLVLFKFSISMLIFCLVTIYIVESRVLKSSTITVELPVSLQFYQFFLMYLRALI